MVLVIVTVVVAMISLAGLAFVTSMHAEGKAVRVGGDQLQLEHVVGSGTELLKALLEQSWEARQEAGGLRDNPQLFRAVLVLDDEETGRRARFSVVAPPGGDGQSAAIRFGVENESARLNLGVLLQWEQRDPGSAHRALMSLPGMTDAIADAILDWIDPDSNPRQLGAEADYYQGLGVPYSPRNGVPQCLEELLLVRGVTRPLLFGDEGGFNRRIEPRGRRAAAERLLGGSSSSGPPWGSLLTVSSGERNQAADGRPRIDLNQDKLAALHEQLLEAFEQRWADFVVLYRQYGPYSGSRTGDQSGPQVDLTLPAKSRLESVLDLIDARLEIPAPAGRTSQVIQSPFGSDPAAIRQYLPKLMDRTSTVSDAVIYGRINVNVAPREVLRAVPGLDGAAVEQIVAGRGRAAGPEPADRRHATWLLTEGLVDLSRMKALMPYLTGGGDVGRAQIVASFDPPGPSLRAETVIDATSSPPRQVYWKDLRLLGRGSGPEGLGAEAAGGPGNASPRVSRQAPRKR